MAGVDGLMTRADLRVSRFALEPIVIVSMAASRRSPGRRCEIEGNEQRTPSLVLAYVNTFVCPRVLERGSIDGEHHVAERDGRCTLAQRAEMRQPPGEQRTLGLDDAGVKRDPAAGGSVEAGEGESDQGRWSSPEIGEYTHELELAKTRKVSHHRPTAQAAVAARPLVATPRFDG
jgi:hypothetical protein